MSVRDRVKSPAYADTLALQRAIVAALRDKTTPLEFPDLNVPYADDLRASADLLVFGRENFKGDRYRRRLCELPEFFRGLEELSLVEDFVDAYHWTFTGGSGTRRDELPQIVHFGHEYVARRGLPPALSDVLEYCSMSTTLVEAARPAMPPTQDLTAVLSEPAAVRRFDYDIAPYIAGSCLVGELRPDGCTLFVIRDVERPISTQIFVLDEVRSVELLLTGAPLCELIEAAARPDELMSFLGELQALGMLTWRAQ